MIESLLKANSEIIKFFKEIKESAGNFDPAILLGLSEAHNTLAN